MLELLSLLKEIVDGSLYEESDDIAGQESDKQPDTTDMPDLESEECAEQRKKSIRTRTKNTNTRSNAQ